MADLLATYCIETSSIVDLARRRFPDDLYPGLLAAVEGMVSAGQIVAPREVYRELEKSADEVLEWAKNRKGMFVDPTPRQIELLRDMRSRDQRVFSLNKPGPDADPWVVAVAVEGNLKVITSENRVGGNAQKFQIPNLCEMFSVECLDLFGMFRSLEWQFTLQTKDDGQSA